MKLLLVCLLAAVVVQDVVGNCGNDLDTFVGCLIDIRKSKEVQTVVEKHLEALKQCGVSNKTLSCLKAKSQCEDQTENKVHDSKEKKQSVTDAAKCWDKQPNDPLSGLDELFSGLKGLVGHINGRRKIHEGDEGLPPPPPPGSDPSSWSPILPGSDKNSLPPVRPGGDSNSLPPLPVPGSDKNSLPPVRPGGDSNSLPPLPVPGSDKSFWPPNARGPWAGGHGHNGPPHAPHPFFSPLECRIDSDDDDDAINCTVRHLADNVEIVKLAKGLRDKLKACKQGLPLECKPRGPGLFGCLAGAWKPSFDLATTSYKECMNKAGFTLPDRPPFPPMPLLGGGARNHSMV